VSIWIRLRLDDLGSNPVVARGFIFPKTSRRGSGIQPTPYLVITGGCFLNVKRLGFVANHSSPSSADVKIIGAIRPVTLYAEMACIRIAVLFDVFIGNLFLNSLDPRSSVKWADKILTWILVKEHVGLTSCYSDLKVSELNIYLNLFRP